MRVAARRFRRGACRIARRLRRGFDRLGEVRIANQLGHGSLVDEPFPLGVRGRSLVTPSNGFESISLGERHL